MTRTVRLSIQRASQAGVGILVTIGTSLSDSAWNVDWVKSQPSAYATVGQHPELVDQWRDRGYWKNSRPWPRQPKVVAIGEVGLDYHRPGYDQALQV